MAKIENIFVFLSPEYLKIFISLSVNKLLKKPCHATNCRARSFYIRVMTICYL